MSELWNNIIEPMIKEFNPNTILEIGSNESNIFELLEYMSRVDGCLYCIDPSPDHDFKLFEYQFPNIYKHYFNIPVYNLLNLNIDMILINENYDSSKVIEYLKMVDRKDELLPIVLFHDKININNLNFDFIINEVPDRNIDILNNKKLDQNENISYKKEKKISDNTINENNNLHKFEEYIKDSKKKNKLIFQKIDKLNGFGILIPENMIECFQNVTFFSKEQNLYNQIENLKEKLEKKNKKFSEKNKLVKKYSNSLSWKVTNPLRVINEICRKIIFNPYIFIILKSNIHFKKSFQYIKAYGLIKNSPFLFDEKFYKREYPSIKKFKFTPLIHYIYYGYGEGKLPNEYFNSEKFNNKIKTEMNPLVYNVLFNEDTYNEIQYHRLRSTGNDKNIFRRLYKEILFKKNLKISIKVPANDEGSAFFWGDYHFAQALKKEFEKENYKTKLIFRKNWDKKDDSDVSLTLRGLFEYKTKKNQINIMWNISHPDLVSAREYNTYDHVFVASDIFTKKLKKILKVPVTSLLQCTDSTIFYPEYSDKYKHELLFVGNSRGVFRSIIKDLLPTERELGLYGRNWNEFLPKETVTGTHIPNNELNKAYSSCKILLNDHWEDMGKNGFISNRIFDGFACGSFIISDKIEGIEFLKNSLVTYKNPEELKKLIDYYLENKKERLKKAENAKKIVLESHTFEKRAKEILKTINKLKKG